MIRPLSAPTAPRATRRGKNARGYTAVELVMAIGVFAVGITGVFAMQKVTAASGAYAKNLAVATRVAESWQERLAIDALRWTSSTTYSNTTWITVLSSAGNNNVWLLPGANLTGDFGTSFDILGRYTATAADVVFCTHVRLTQLFTEPGNGLIRSEVRVFWPKGGPAWNGGAAYCAAAVSTADITSNDFHFVQNATVIRQTEGL